MDSDSTPNPPRLTAVEIQQEYYEAVGDIDWELYTKQDRPYLLQKVAVAICGPPTKEGNLKLKDDFKLQGYEKREEEISQNVFEKICEQAKYSSDKENIYISIIRVVCVSPSTPVPFYKFTPSDYWVDLHQKRDDVMMCIFHVFSIRKCIPTKTDGVASVSATPVKTGVAVALFVPVIAPVALPTALGVGVVTGVYGIARSTANLIDRNQHEQSIGLGNTEARASWINIMVSTAGISATGATKLLSWAAASGTNVEILMNAVRLLQYTNLGTGFIGVANSLSDMIIKYATYNETPTALEVFQFTTSALFLGLGVMTNQTAQEIVQDAQAKTINDIRDSLPSNVKKKMFDKVTAETRRVQGTIKGNADVIKALNKIDNKNEFFAKLARINKQINRNQLRISLSPDGNALFNNQHKIGVSELHGLGKSGRDQLFARYGAATVTTENAPTRIYASNSYANGPSWLQEAQWNITPEDIAKISTFLLSLSKLNREGVAEVLSQISGYLHDYFLLFCIGLIATLTPYENETLRNLDPDYKVKIILIVYEQIKSMIPKDESDKELSFANLLKEFIVMGKLEAKTTLKIIEIFIEKGVFDDMYKIGQYKNLQAGEILVIGNHSVLLKKHTVDKLDEWLEMFSQQGCDIFMKLCYKIISSLSSNDINELIEINFDEDIIMRVSHYMLFETETVINFLTLGPLSEDVLIDLALNLKKNLIEWRTSQVIRKYKTCNECSGINYLIEE